MFRSAEVAYAALDFTGLGYITDKAFLNSIIVKERVPFSTEQIKMYFKEYNLFPPG